MVARAKQRRNRRRKSTPADVLSAIAFPFTASFFLVRHPALLLLVAFTVFWLLPESLLPEIKL